MPPRRAPIGGHTRNLGMYPDQESNPQLFGVCVGGGGDAPTNRAIWPRPNFHSDWLKWSPASGQLWKDILKMWSHRTEGSLLRGGSPLGGSCLPPRNMCFQCDQAEICCCCVEPMKWVHSLQQLPCSDRSVKITEITNLKIGPSVNGLL